MGLIFSSPFTSSPCQQSEYTYYCTISFRALKCHGSLDKREQRGEHLRCADGVGCFHSLAALFFENREGATRERKGRDAANSQRRNSQSSVLIWRPVRGNHSIQGGEAVWRWLKYKFHCKFCARPGFPFARLPHSIL